MFAPVISSQRPARSAAPLRQALAPKTFNCLPAPRNTWAWGDIDLINQAGSYGERFYSFAGPADQIAELLMVAVDTATWLAHKSILDGRPPPTLGIGWWQGDQWDLLVVMGLTGREEECAIAHAQDTHPDLFAGLLVLTDGALMDGASDTFWNLLDHGMANPNDRDRTFSLALQLVSSAELDGLAEGGPRGHALWAWNSARGLSRSLPARESQGSIKRI